MRAWLLRGCAMAVPHAVVQTLIAAFAVYHPYSLGVLRPLAIGLLAGVVVLAAAVDTWRRLPDRGLVWLKASLLAGWTAGLLGVIGQALFVDQTGVSALGGALTGGAAFTALLVLVPASFGLLLGKLLDSHSAARMAALDEHEEQERQDDSDGRDGPLRRQRDIRRRAAIAHRRISLRGRTPGTAQPDTPEGH